MARKTRRPSGVRDVVIGASPSDSWKAFREYATEILSQADQAGIENPIGEWVGVESNRERNARTDSLVALASFVAETITTGCACDECDSRRQLVTNLVYGKSVNATAIDDAIQPVNPDSLYDGMPCRWCGNTHERSEREPGTELGRRCAVHHRKRERRLHGRKRTKRAA